MMRTEKISARGVVVVTAAGSEQGRRTAQELLDSGWCVAVTARTVAELARIMPGMSGRRLLAVAADPGDPRQVERLLDRVLARFGRIDSVLGAESSIVSAWRRRTPWREVPRPDGRSRLGGLTIGSQVGGRSAANSSVTRSVESVNR